MADKLYLVLQRGGDSTYRLEQTSDVDTLPFTLFYSEHYQFDFSSPEELAQLIKKDPDMRDEFKEFVKDFSSEFAVIELTEEQLKSLGVKTKTIYSL